MNGSSLAWDADKKTLRDFACYRMANVLELLCATIDWRREGGERRPLFGNNASIMGKRV